MSIEVERLQALRLYRNKVRAARLAASGSAERDFYLEQTYWNALSRLKRRYPGETPEEAKARREHEAEIQWFRDVEKEAKDCREYQAEIQWFRDVEYEEEAVHLLSPVRVENRRQTR
jgi:hypothetical protein